MHRVDELLALITAEQQTIVDRLNTHDVVGIHEFVMEHGAKALAYRKELAELIGEELADDHWHTIIRTVYKVQVPSNYQIYKKWLDRGETLVYDSPSQ
ncbi:MAG: hypothetical protein NVSMB27_17560 [Ktedonobacteraceae bacterium]